MADPRLGISHEGNNPVYETFIIDDSEIEYDAGEAGGSDKVGLAVTLTSTANVVSTVADGEKVLGKLIKVEADNRCTVQIGGGMTLPGGTSASLTVGKKIVGDLLSSAEGYIREVADPTTVDPTLAQLLELNDSRGLICDASTTTAVEVIL